MNDNIRAIWNRAASSHQQADTSRETQENFINRFAELIVRECAEISEQSQWSEAKGEYYEGFNEAMIYVSNKIKEHFGLENES